MAAENTTTSHLQLNAINVPISIELPGIELPAGAGAAGPGANELEASKTGASAAAQLAGDPHWEGSIELAVSVAAQSQGYCRGQIGVLVTDDATIQQINLRHLDHDYPTDVISFCYRRDAGEIDGELVVSLCTAVRLAAECGWDWRSELLLYVIHGTLHICGLDDSTADQRQQMRRFEQAALSKLGIEDAEALRQGFEPLPDPTFSSDALPLPPGGGQGNWPLTCSSNEKGASES